LRDGSTLTNVAVPDMDTVDLVVAHTLHSNVDMAIVQSASLVLDATYRLENSPNVVRL
jgi:hypothetical protein